MDVLENYWDKIISKLTERAGKLKDQKAKALITEIVKVRPAIRKAMLKEWVIRCKENYNIAFLQWRLKFPSTKYYMESSLHIAELEETIMGRIKHREENIKDDLQVLLETEEKA